MDYNVNVSFVASNMLNLNFFKKKLTNEIKPVNKFLNNFKVIYY
jgi:hypothetical protein